MTMRVESYKNYLEATAPTIPRCEKTCKDAEQMVCEDCKAPTYLRGKVCNSFAECFERLRADVCDGCEEVSPCPK